MIKNKPINFDNDYEKIKKDNFVKAEVQGKFYFQINQDLTKEMNKRYYDIGIIDDIGIIHQ